MNKAQTNSMVFSEAIKPNFKNRTLMQVQLLNQMCLLLLSSSLVQFISEQHTRDIFPISSCSDWSFCILQNKLSYDMECIDHNLISVNLLCIHHGCPARWRTWRACDVGEAKGRLENELWHRRNNGSVGDELWRRQSDGRVGELAVT